MIGIYEDTAVKIPAITVLVGLPGSGKTTIAEELENKNTVIHSSDKLREELYGDENTQEHNADLFSELHRRIKEDLRNGKNVIYDATNISKKRRTAFLRELKSIPCRKICICVMTPYEICIANNSARKRNVPEYVIKKMYMNWNPPALHEGFDEIQYQYNYGKNSESIKRKYKLTTLFDKEHGIDKFLQENKHHAHTLGMHCRKAYEYTLEHFPASTLLHIASLLHDNGKVFTKTQYNTKGEIDGDYHYYQHHCVGAYDSLFYTDNLNLSNEDITYISNLIYFHMHPYMSWHQSQRVLKNDKAQIGDKMYNDIMRLHEADLAAH